MSLGIIILPLYMKIIPMIQTIEKELGLRVDWRAYPELRERYKWLLELEENVDFEIRDKSKNEEIRDLESRIDDYWYEVEGLKSENAHLEIEIEHLKEEIQTLRSSMI